MAASGNYRFRLHAYAAVAVLMTCALPLPASSLAAQSLLERTPNVSGGWTGDSGQLYFNFVHRFSHSGAPERQVQNRPTLLFAYAAPAGILAGAHYTTRSELAAGVPNEWELFVRARPVARTRGAPLDVSLQVGHNMAAASWDSELSAARPFGPVHALLALRVLSSDVLHGGVAGGVAAGGAVRLRGDIVVAADAGRIWSDAGAADVTWSAGLHARLPATPHTLSLHATNVSATTLHSASRPSDRVRWGFEFTVPITLRRYLGARAARPADDGHGSAASMGRGVQAAGDTLVRAALHNLQFMPATVTIRRGTTVEWVNRDPLEHTVTAADGSWDSGPIAPQATWRRRFEEPGRYLIICTPHPFMRAEVIVE